MIRVVVGVIVAAHGFQQLARDPANFGGFLTRPGVPAPAPIAYAVAFVELVGGILLVKQVSAYMSVRSP